MSQAQYYLILTESRYVWYISYASPNRNALHWTPPIHLPFIPWIMEGVFSYLISRNRTRLHIMLAKYQIFSLSLPSPPLPSPYSSFLSEPYVQSMKRWKMKNHHGRSTQQGTDIIPWRRAKFGVSISTYFMPSILNIKRFWLLMPKHLRRFLPEEESTVVSRPGELASSPNRNAPRARGWKWVLVILSVLSSAFLFALE